MIHTHPFIMFFNEDSNKWTDIPCSWIGRYNIAKTAILNWETVTDV